MLKFSAAFAGIFYCIAIFSLLAIRHLTTHHFIFQVRETVSSSISLDGGLWETCIRMSSL